MKSTVGKKLGAAMLLLVPVGAALVSQSAMAQYYPQRDYPYHASQAEPATINSLSLNSDAGLNPGATLRVQVSATPGARWANVSLGDSGVRVPLREQSPGEYVGTYVVRRGERVDPSEDLTVRAGWGEGPVTVSFNYPRSFQALAMGAGPAAIGNPAVTSFAMSPTDDLDPGTVVRFRLEGTPRARVWVNIPDVVRGLPMREVRPGVYVGRYTIRRGDDPDAFDEARAVLSSGNQRVVARVNTTEERYGYGYGR